MRMTAMGVGKVRNELNRDHKDRRPDKSRYPLLEHHSFNHNPVSPILRNK
jgi:hypothetical protein